MPQQLSAATTTLRRAEEDGALHAAMTTLEGLPGLMVVMAAKVLRSVRPGRRAAADRHAGHFSNSLVDRSPRPSTACTAFQREWGRNLHDRSRLATFRPRGAAHATQHWCERFFPAPGPSHQAATNRGPPTAVRRRSTPTVACSRRGDGHVLLVGGQRAGVAPRRRAPSRSWGAGLRPPKCSARHGSFMVEWLHNMATVQHVNCTTWQLYTSDNADLPDAKTEGLAVL